MIRLKFRSVLARRRGMLKLQAPHGLSPAQTSYLVQDRPSFLRFPGLDLHEKTSDARMVRPFRDHLARANAEETPPL